MQEDLNKKNSYQIMIKIKIMINTETAASNKKRKNQMQLHTYLDLCTVKAADKSVSSFQYLNGLPQHGSPLVWDN